MQKRGRIPNASFFAFTATPKHKTLQLFGSKRADGKYEPFSLYTMRQAIEEGFILDVLQNYTTYKAYWNLLKKIEEDPHYDRRKAGSLLKAFVDLHEETIARKVAIMLEHFDEQVASRIHGRAKAMIVTPSRLHAVRYYQAVRRSLEEQGLPYKALVAFSGKVIDNGITYEENKLNGLPESQTAEAFKKDEYRFLIVANKFQTGFDQPLLLLCEFRQPCMPRMGESKGLSQPFSTLSIKSGECPGEIHLVLRAQPLGFVEQLNFWSKIGNAIRCDRSQSRERTTDLCRATRNPFVMVGVYDHQLESPGITLVRTTPNIMDRSRERHVLFPFLERPRTG